MVDRIVVGQDSMPGSGEFWARSSGLLNVEEDEYRRHTGTFVSAQIEGADRPGAWFVGTIGTVWSVNSVAQQSTDHAAGSSLADHPKLEELERWVVRQESPRAD
jgi:hypothetical protein